MTKEEDRLDRLSRAWSKQRPKMDLSPWQVWGRITWLNDIFLSRLSHLLNQHDLNFKELQTLGALIVGGPPYEANPNKISQHNLLTSGGMTNALTRMEKKGLITRRKDPKDGRAVIVTVTNKGLEAFNDVIVKENSIEHKLLDGVSDEERKAVAVVLRKVLRNIDQDE